MYRRRRLFDKCRSRDFILCMELVERKTGSLIFPIGLLQTPKVNRKNQKQCRLMQPTHVAKIVRRKETKC